MNFDRVIQLAEALGYTSLVFKFIPTEPLNAPDHQWRAEVVHDEGSVYDYGANPIAAIAAVEVALYRKVESRMKGHEDEAAKYRALLMPTELPGGDK